MGNEVVLAFYNVKLRVETFEVCILSTHASDVTGRVGLCIMKVAPAADPDSFSDQTSA